jgi:hypothetical protein
VNFEHTDNWRPNQSSPVPFKVKPSDDSSPKPRRLLQSPHLQPLHKTIERLWEKSVLREHDAERRRHMGRHQTPPLQLHG